ncbi:MAG: MBOAT family protein [Firmicutes bacterium]|nr:MBOAT family protein [Bacillota bacterium]
MIFSSIPFLYYFLPAVILLYFIVPKKMANSVLLLASLFFYGYGEPKMLPVMVVTIIAAWVLGLMVPKHKACFYLSAAICLGLLVWFKGGFAGNALPAGISFYTFQILSYTIDLRRGNIRPQKNLRDFAMYVSMFPQLIAGPIVVYSTVEDRLDPLKRKISAEDIYEGACRFAFGLAKKVLLANNLGQFVSLFQSTAADDRTVMFYWAYALAFSMQIYFDFSGYSDMAIGLGRIFGFSFPENFNYPFISKSITEFWRRWHMTLGGWFREYVYIPLGGNRVGRGRWIFNIFVVWALTGLWHGVQWTFLVWGLYFGVLLMAEKLWLGRVLDKLPAWVQHIYTIVLVLFSMVIFNGGSIGEAMSFIGAMIGIGSAGGGAIPLTGVLSSYYIRSFGVLFIVSIAASTPIAKKLSALRYAEWLKPAAAVILLLLVTAYLADGSYNPFLYFRF